jgi:hypothetical protein
MVAGSALLAQPAESTAGWSPPETVAVLSPTPLAVGIAKPHLSLNAADDAIVGWSQESVRGSRSTNAMVVTRYAGSSWSSPLRLNSSGSTARAPAVAISPLGEATVVWSQRTSRSRHTRVAVMARSYSPAHGWGTVEQLAVGEDDREGPALSIPDPDPRIALDHAGNPTVSFNLGRTSAREFIEITSRTRGGRWRRPVAVARTAHCFETQLALDARGEVLLAWIHGSDIVPETFDWVEALTLNRDHRPEGSPQVLSSTQRESYGLNLATNARGEAALLWGVEWGVEGKGGARVEATTRTSMRRFSRAVALTSRVRSQPSGLVVDARGVATALLETTVPESSTHPPKGRWSRPAGISSAPVEQASLAGETQGDLAAIWTTRLAPAPGEQFESDAIAASLQTHPGYWQSPSLISPPHARAAAVATGARGEILVVWEQEHAARLEAADYVP